MTPEGKIKRKLREKLNALPKRYIFMPVQTGLGATTLDYLICVNGHFVAIETKALGKTMTQRQELIAYQIMLSGGTVFVVDSEDAIDQCIAKLFLLEKFGP